MHAPLDGIRVLEVAGWVAAPSAGAIMADLGADVVKVEPPGGDGMRSMLRQARPEGVRSQVDHPFHMDNRGKRSMAIAMDTPEGAELVASLAGDFDVLLTNVLPQRQRKYGIAPEMLLARHPRLVHATVTGYGTDGPDAHLPGFDVTSYFSRGGVYSFGAGPDGQPRRGAAAQGDHTTGLAIFGAIMVGLRHRDATGSGLAVEASLLRTAAWTLASDLSAALVDGQNPPPTERGKLMSPLLNPFRFADGKWVQFAMPNSEGNWRRFCTAIDRPDLIDDERFATPRGRFRNQSELLAEVDPVVGSRRRSEWAQAFDDQDLIWAPVNELADLPNDPQLRAAGVFGTVHHPDGAFETTNAPFVLHGADVGIRGPGPKLDEHGGAVLAQAGYSTEEIERLRASGVIGPTQPSS